MLEHVVRLLKDYTFILRITELILAFVALGLLTQYEEYALPRWLWFIYCIDSLTYAVIFFVLALANVLQKERQAFEFTYLAVGTIFYCSGGIAGIARTFTVLSTDCEVYRSELGIGTTLICNSLLMFSETAYKICLQSKAQNPENTENT